MNLQTIYPVFIPYNDSGHSIPMTEQDVKVLLGMLIIIHIIYVISSLPQIYYLIKDKYSIAKNFKWLEDNFIQLFSGLSILIIDGILLLIYLGSLIAKFLL